MKIQNNKDFGKMEKISIKTKISDILFQTCLWNAAGPRCTSKEELDILVECEGGGAIVTKTCTLKQREGNVFPRVCCTDPSVSINSVGLANEGIDMYLEWLKTSSSTKPVFLSIGGLDIQENKELLRKVRMSDTKPHFIELNVSCPNLLGKSIVAYDLDRLKQYLNLLTINIKLMHDEGVDIGCGVKLPPYFDRSDIFKVAEIINSFEEIDYVTTINGVPNCLIVDTESEEAVIKPKKGFGGVGGGISKPIGLSNVAKLRENLRENISIIGCGGVCTGEDVFQYILCGADAVEIATQFLYEGEKCFDRISAELKKLMKSKGYTHINQFKGKILL